MSGVVFTPEQEAVIAERIETALAARDAEWQSEVSAQSELLRGEVRDLLEAYPPAPTVLIEPQRLS